MIFNRKSKMNKRGNVVLDTLFFVVVTIAISTVMLIMYPVINDINDDFQDDADYTADSKTAIESITTNYAPILDGAFILLVFALWVLVIVASFRVDSHPIFFVITIVMMLFIFYVGAELGNFYEDLSTDDDLQEATDNFPKLNFIMNNFLETIIIIAFTIVTALYGKNKFAGGVP